MGVLNKFQALNRATISTISCNFSVIIFHLIIYLVESVFRNKFITNNRITKLPV